MSTLFFVLWLVGLPILLIICGIFIRKTVNPTEKIILRDFVWLVGISFFPFINFIVFGIVLIIMFYEWIDWDRELF